MKLINASHAPKLFIQLDEPMRAQVKISNTCGEVVSEQRLVLQPGIVALDIPCIGLAELEIARKSQYKAAACNGSLFAFLNHEPSAWRQQ